MRTPIRFGILLLLVLPLRDPSQAQWQWQNPLPQGNRLNKIQFVDSLCGWIQGGGGSLLRTTDGGNYWNLEYVPYGYTRIHFVDREYGWAVGSGRPPFILRTRDGGRRWEPLPIPPERDDSTHTNFNDVFFLSRLNGYVVDNRRGIFHTVDGGKHWQLQGTTTIRGRDMRSVWFIDSIRGFITSFDAIAFPLRYTTNGGAVWLLDSTVADARSDRIWFVDSLHGWIVQSNSLQATGVLRTEDGGRTWSAHGIPSSAEGAADLMFLNSERGWLALPNVLATTFDGGQTWMPLDSSHGYAGVAFLNLTTGWATDASTYKYYRSSDGGTTWQDQTSGITEKTLMNVDFVDETTGWIVGKDGSILHSTSGGASWSRQVSGTTSWLRDVLFLNTFVGWVVGFNGTVLHTSDAGENWERKSTGVSHNLEQVSSITTQESWVVGWSYDDPSPGILLHTTNAGETWQNETPQGSSRLFGLAFISRLRGFVATGGPTVYDSARLFTTSDGGQTWHIQVDRSDDSFGRITFVDSLHGWVAGETSMLRTTDGGTTWIVMPPTFAQIRFVDSEYGWAVSSGGRIAHTTNGGEIWSLQQSRTSRALWGLDFVNRRLGWAVGDFGVVLHTDNGGTTAVGENTQWTTGGESVQLFSNYPNPFNPNTTIRFQIPSNGLVTLKVYNLLGQEVASLVNEVQSAGSYEVGFDASRLASGVYICKLAAGNFAASKKLLLVR